MIKNFLKIAFRTLYRDKWYSIVNIGGLAIGMCVTLLLSLYVRHELSFDKFHKDFQRIYRINTHINQEGFDEKKYPVTVYETGDVLAERLADVEMVTRLFFSTTGETYINNDTKQSQSLIYTDKTFFNLFNFPIIKGNAKSPIDDPNSIVISEKVAQSWFGSEDPIGKSVNIYTFDYDTIERKLIKRPQTLTVSAIMGDAPKNSQLQPKVVTNFRTMSEVMLRVNGFDFYTYIKTKKLLDEHLENQIAEINAEQIEAGFGKTHPKELTSTHLMPISKIHLHSDYQSEVAITSSYSFVITLGIVAALVLIIASINFINLSTARADNRKREVGIRKTVGSKRLQLIAQFIGESILSSIIALFVSLMLLELLIGPFNSLISTNISLDYKNNVILLISVIGLAVVVGAIGGLYPSIYISRFKPITILRGITSRGKQNPFVKTTLIVFQFGIAAVLIFGLVVINSQMRYMKSKDLGFNQQNVILFFGLTESIVESYKPLSNDLRSIPNVISMSAAQSYPSAGLSGMNLALEGTDPSKAFSVKEHRVQDHYIETMQMQIVKGRDFRPNSIADDEGYIINETAAKMLGVENPIDARVMMWRRPGKIIGIIKDYHFASLRNDIEPLVISRYNPRMFNLTLRIEDFDKDKTVDRIVETIRKYDPNYKPSYRYLQDMLMAQYGSEEKTFRLILSASTIALILSMIGLYALSAYALANRTKELGVRKILGASLPTLLKILLLDSTKWVLIANAIALPIGWYFSKNWLNDFAFRIDISAWIFVTTLFLTFSIALITIFWQVLKAAQSNPIEALRYE